MRVLVPFTFLKHSLLQSRHTFCYQIVSLFLLQDINLSYKWVVDVVPFSWWMHAKTFRKPLRGLEIQTHAGYRER